MKNITSAQSWILKGMLFALPVFFLPVTSDFFDFNKLALLVFGTLVGIIVWLASSIRGEFKFKVTTFDIPVVAFALAVLASAIIVSPNKTDAFIFPGTASVVAFGTLFYFLVVQYVRGEKDIKESLILPLLAGSSVAALISLIATVGGLSLLSKVGSFPAWLAQPTFNTTGGLLPALTLFAALLPISIMEGLTSKGTKSAIHSAFLIMIVLGLAATAYFALPGKPTSPQLLPISTGWSIALETLKQSPWLGVGPGNFTEAFNRFRPVDYNATNVWSLRFGVSSNWYLHLWTITGLAGIVTFLWIVLKIANKLKSSSLGSVHYALIATLVLFLVFPASNLLIMVFYFLLALVASDYSSEIALQFTARGINASVLEGKKLNLFPALLSILVIGGFAASAIYAKGVYAAEVSYKKALDAAARNDGRETYNALIDTIRQNAYVDRYRITYSQINLALANNIASRQDINDQDRQTVSQLIQQSIREGQAAVSLNQSHAQNWENLARIYQALFPFAQGADQWAVSSYQQSIALDPVNPLLRLSLGGVYYSLKQQDNAVRVFELAVASKPDFANAHYNLAVALRDKGETLRSAQEMAQTLNLITPGTPDFDTARKELESLQQKLTQEASASGQVAGAKTAQTQQPALQAPSPAPKQVIEPPIQLPANAAPPSPNGEVAQPSPTPTPAQ